MSGSFVGSLGSSKFLSLSLSLSLIVRNLVVFFTGVKFSCHVLGCNCEGSTKSEEGEGSSGKCLNEAEGMDVDQSDLDAASLEGPGKSESPKISSHESSRGC